MLILTLIAGVMCGIGMPRVIKAISADLALKKEEEKQQAVDVAAKKLVNLKKWQKVKREKTL